MNQKLVHVFLVLIGWLILSLIVSVHSHAQSSIEEQELPVRDQTYIRNLVALSEVIGSAHAVRVRCNGDNDQYWRSYMVQILGIEAPDRSSLRRSMVDSFNRGFQKENRARFRCDAGANEIEARYAADGQRLSEQLAAHYFPRRND